MKEICADLANEQEELDAFVADLDEDGWNTMTPAEDWTIKDQIRHLAYFDDRARLAATDPEEGGVISPGGVGYDINCGVRVLRTNLRADDVAPRITTLMDKLFAAVPTGVGSSASPTAT